MLPEQRAAAAADINRLPGNHQTAWQEETGVEHVIHELHHAGGFERRECKQEQKRGHELRPNKERQAHPAHALGAQLDDGGDEIHRPQQRRRDEQHHADEPESLSVNAVRQVRHRGQRRIGSPARARRAAGDEEACQHDHAAGEKTLEADHVDAREGHVRRADLQRHDVVAEGREGERHNREEDHDGAVHGAERVVEVRRHDAAGNHHLALFAQNPLQENTDQGNGLAGIGDLPAHRRHQQEAEEQEEQRGDAILNPDDLVVGREKVLAHEARLFMSVRLVRRVCRRMCRSHGSLCVHCRKIPKHGN